MFIKKIAVLLILVLLVFALTSQVVKYQVSKDKCIGCGLCVQTKVCPTNAIQMKSGKAIIDMDKCIACGLCKNENPSVKYPGCPTKAIDQVKIEEKQITTQEIKPSSNTTTIVTEKDKVKEAKPTETAKAVEKKQETTKPQSDSLKNEEENIVKKVIYYVESKTCIGCRLCVSQCPVNAISMQKGKAIIDMDKCISCSICKNGNPSNNYKGCPVEAIKTK